MKVKRKQKTNKQKKKTEIKQNISTTASNIKIQAECC